MASLTKHHKQKDITLHEDILANTTTIMTAVTNFKPLADPVDEECENILDLPNNNEGILTNLDHIMRFVIAKVSDII